MKDTEFDFLIVGAGLYGSVFAQQMLLKGKRSLIIDKRNHIGGNVYTEEVEGIQIHKYGPHIFHTNDKSIWDFVNSFVEFNRFTNSPLASYDGKMYNLPFNMNTFYQLWGVRTPEEAKSVIQAQRVPNSNPQNLEEFALREVGTDIYEKLIKGYTEKQWGRSCSELPMSILKRLPIRMTFDNNYYNDKYQGVPKGGYTNLVSKLQEGIEVKLGLDFFQNQNKLKALAQSVVYTGKIDEYFNYKFGKLAYRSVSFKEEVIRCPNYQGNAIVNYTSKDVPYTRIIEHKHFEFGKQKFTVISKEFPKESGDSDEAHYPIGDSINRKIYSKYKKLGDEEKNVIFGGRLAEYKYYDMHQVIGSALSTSAKYN